MFCFDLRSVFFALGSLIRTMIGFGVGVIIAGATIDVSIVLIVLSLVVKFSGWETGMKV